MKYSFEFQKQPLEKRKSESARIRQKYPDRLPVIVEVHRKEANSITLDKKKYLVPDNMTIGEFNYVLCKRQAKHDATKALFMFTENQSLLCTEDMLKTIYNKEKNEDGFLYFVVTREETFGSA